jgi:hypothetical protein
VLSSSRISFSDSQRFPVDSIRITNGGGGRLTDLFVSVTSTSAPPGGAMSLQHILRSGTAPTFLVLSARPVAVSGPVTVTVPPPAGPYSAVVTVASLSGAARPVSVTVTLTVAP